MRRPRRAMAVLGVMLVVVIGALVAAGVVAVVDARLRAARVGLDQTQVRLLAMSGLRGVVAELEAQRAAMLEGRGAEPRLTRAWSMSVAGGLRGVVRLVPWPTSGEPVMAQSEAARLDVNVSAGAMLARLPGLDEASGDRIVAKRPAHGYETPAEVVALAGIPPDLFDASGDEERSDGVRLDRCLTTLSAEPNTQVGLGAKGAAHAGRRRIDLSRGWSDELAQALAARLTPEGTHAVAEALQRRGKAVRTPGDMGELINDPAMSGRPEILEEALDALTWTSDRFVFGRIDVRHAPAAVLAVVPGIDATLAERIASRRSSLGLEEAGTVAWLTGPQGVLTGEQFAMAAPWLVSRSLQWRVRLEAGLADGDAPESDALVALRGVVRLEAVVDLADEEPRVAYLREITLLPLASQLAREVVREPVTVEGPPTPAALEPENPAEPDALPPSAPTNSSGNDQPPAGEPLHDTPGKDSRRGRWRSRPA